ncbi:hypothetical protein DFH11DRAFT_1545758 [Phellopilus nigrolimitatus]|nr:hypothetical protein DFH11DRAFT_1545758 [Phellopilus nigrolimitatus]
MDADLDAELFTALKIALSATFIGYSVATTLYGITCLQLYLYYRNHPKDPLFVKILVTLLWALDTLTTALIGHTIYYYLVLNLGKANVVFIIPWSYADTITFITQSYFAWQILMGCFGVFRYSSVADLRATGVDMEVVIYLFRNQSGLSLANPAVWISGSIAQGLDALCDIIITVSFIYYLKANRSGVRSNTQQMVDNLVVYAVTRDCFRVTGQRTFDLHDVAFPGEVYWVPFQQTVGKLYINSLLASLNARKSLASTNAGFSGLPRGDLSATMTSVDRHTTLEFAN